MSVKPNTDSLRVNHSRLMDRLFALAEIGAIDGGGCSRLALTDDDKAGRDLVVEWMQELGLAVSIDTVGNVVGIWNVGHGAPVMTGSHIDTVRTGGKYDGNYGVLAGLEVIQTCQENNVIPSRPLAVGFFTNEEGSRYAPDMFGSLTYVGGLSVEEALDTVGIDGSRVGDELTRIGYLGNAPCPGPSPAAFVELHIEQGPILEHQDHTIGVVTGVQGISWQEVTISGQSNHAGTTPMSMRHDPSYVAAAITVFLRELTQRYSGHQVCTVGKVDLHPNLINVIPARAVLTLDVRNTDETVLQMAENEIKDFLDALAIREGVTITTRILARFEPVVFDDMVVDTVEQISASHNYPHMRLPSGAGHDAQMFARICPSGMIFVPSINGISHNPAEDTSSTDLEAGANVLLHTMLKLTESLDK
ncbi:MAG: hydantoinase/carbamoylase family amidase [Actinobacteria bacterium]|nr:hydantoinase/carbamoylase family amidase [Actinomycetota bacterium]